MKKKTDYLTTAEKTKIAKRRKFAVDFAKVYPGCFIATGLLTVFAIFMTGDFTAAFTSERAAATAGVFVLNEVLVGFMIASTHAAAEDRRFPVRNVLLSFVMLAVAYMACLTTSRFLNIFALPMCLVALVLTELSGRRTSSVTSLVLAAMLCVVFIHGERYPDTMLPEVILSVVGNFTAALAATMLVDKHLARLPFVLAALGATALGIVPVFAGTLVMGDISIALLFNVLWSYGASVGAVLVFMPIVAVLEGVFNIADDFRLNELTNLNQPLLKRLASEAPGTFNHSLVVGNLSEACAGAIGENPHMARAAAYYHDIGKLKAPVYFSENQSGYNPHDELIPEVSVSMITSHTVFGEILAKQYRLPPEIVAVCKEHHGTSPVGYFYRKALNLTEEGDLSVSNYTYPGPKPQTKIAAIVMIADTVEAACRAYMPDSQEGFVERVNKLVDEKAAAGSVRRVSHHHEGPLRHQDHHHRDFAAGAARQSFLREEEGMIEFTGARFAERRLIRKVEKAVYAELGQTDIFERGPRRHGRRDGAASSTARRGEWTPRRTSSPSPISKGLKLPVTDGGLLRRGVRRQTGGAGQHHDLLPARALCRRRSTVTPTSVSWASSPVTGCCTCSASTTSTPRTSGVMRAVTDKVMERVELTR